ncbi:MAG: oligosaccharide flippase family protein [Oscillospiraceae bacterium]|nr:oligosaccharide flippase family protein [Oscillospiraceae bacterium]
MSRTQNAITNTVFGLFLKLYQAVMPFVIRTVMIRTIGINYLGLNSLFSSVLQTLSIAELGISGAITFSMYEPIAQKDTRKVCALLRLYRLLYGIIGLAVFLLGASLIPFLPKLISGEVPADINIYVLYAMYLVSTALSYSLFSYRSSLLEAHQHNSVISKISIVTSTIQFALQITFLWLFKNYYLFILTQFALLLVNQTAVFLSVKKLYPDLKPEGTLDRQLIRDIFRKVRDLFTSRIGGIVLHASDTIVISMFLGLTVLAIYQNYFYIITAIAGFISTILSGSRAGIGNSIVTESNEKNYHDFERITFILSGIVCVCTNCFLVLFQPFMKIWMGEENMLPMSMVVMFCLYFVLYEYNQLFNLYKDAAGLWHEDRFRPLVTALTNLSLNILMVQHIGVYGIIASTVLSMLFVGMPWLLHNLFSTLFHRGISRYLKELAKYAAVTLASCLMSFACTSYLSLSGILGLLVYGAVAVCIPCCCYLVLFGKSAYFKDAILLAKRLLLKG